MRIAIYTRVSLDRDKDSPSIDRQEADCRHEIERKGWNVADVFVERNVSAYKMPPLKRPQLKLLLQGIENGTYDGLCVWKMDRLIRRYADYGPLLRLIQDTHATLLSCNDSIDTSTPTGQAILGFTIAQAETEAENISLRVGRAWEERAVTGKPHPGGPRLFGYASNTTREQVPEEVEIARDIRKRLVAGESLRSVAQWLNDSGIHTSMPRCPEGCQKDHHHRLAAGEWSGPGLMQWISRPALAGYRTHRTKTTISNGGRERQEEHSHTQGTWDPIFTVDEWHEVMDVLRSRGRRNTVSKGAKHLLTGLLRCGKCGARLKTMGFRMKNGQSFPRYQCVKQPGHENCGGVAAAKNSLDAFVTDQMLTFLSTAKLRPMGGDERSIEELRRAIEDDERRGQELTMQRFVDGKLPESGYRPAFEAIQAKLATAQMMLEHLEREASDHRYALRPGHRDDLDAWWSSATLEQKRTVLAQTFQEIRIHPAKHRGGNQFDTSRVELVWNWTLYMRAAEEFEANATPEEMAAAEATYERLNEEP